MCNHAHTPFSNIHSSADWVKAAAPQLSQDFSSWVVVSYELVRLRRSDRAGKLRREGGTLNFYS